MKVLLGKTTGEEFQLKFTQGVVIVQPFEEVAVISGGSVGGGAASAAGNILGALAG